MRNNVTYKWINIGNIKYDKLPMNPSTLDLAMKIYNKEIDITELPPINCQLLNNGQYLLKDGRHRYLAFKLNGLTKIYAKVYKSILHERKQ